MSSIHNSNFKYHNFFNVKKIEVVGLNRTDNLLLENELADLIGLNIFSINKEAFRLIDTINLIKSYDVKKIYPNQVKVNLEPAAAISVVKYFNERVVLGNNGKIIDLESLPTNVPAVSGTNDIKKVYKTIKILNESNFDIKDIKNKFFSKRKNRYELENKKKLDFR